MAIFETHHYTMNYNTTRPDLTLPEYGRNVHQMVEHAMTLEDREERNRAAKAIILLMGQLNPHLRDVADFTHKLWDHLFIMSDYKLDVDSPYPTPDREVIERKPERLAYPDHRIKYRHYGRAVEMMIKKCVEMEEGDEKQALIVAIANLMKKYYLVWNRDSVTDEIIFKNLLELSEGKLKAPEGVELADAAVILKSNRPNKKRSNNKKKRKSR